MNKANLRYNPFREEREMNQTDEAGLVDKMHAYVELAEKEIGKRKRECKLLEDELDTTRRLLE